MYDLCRNLLIEHIKVLCTVLSPIVHYSYTNYDGSCTLNAAKDLL